MTGEPQGVRRLVEDKCLAFLAERYCGGGSMGDWDGHFSSREGEAAGDLFGSIDALYVLATLGRLEAATTADSRERWVEFLHSFQSPDGWFRSRDRQKHGRVHATAYALGGLALLGEIDGADPFADLGAIEIGPDLERRYLAPWRELSIAQRVHFWRGSHNVAGLAAVVGQLGAAGHADKLCLSVAPDVWLSRWTDAALGALDERSGLWILTPRWLESAFGLVYRLRHRPEYGHIGGAAHVFWILRKVGIGVPRPRELSEWVLSKTGSRLICENEPYCLDFDRSFMIGRSHSALQDPALAEGVATLLDQSRRDILRFYYDREIAAWNPSSHRLPGALAAVAESDRVSRAGQSETNVGWNDVFETVWWL